MYFWTGLEWKNLVKNLMFGDDELFYLKAYFESGKTKLEKEHKLMLLKEINKRIGFFLLPIGWNCYNTKSKFWICEMAIDVNVNQESKSRISYNNC